MATTKKKTTKKAAKKGTKKGSSKPRKAARKTARKAPKKGPSHHLASAHTATMRAVPHVTKRDVEAIKRLARAVEHAEHNAKYSRE